MSDIPADYRDRLDLRTVISEIDRKQAETQKLQQESDKFIAEQRKLIAEGRYNRDKWIIPITGVLSALAIIVAGVIARLPEILHAIRWGIPQ